MRRLMIVVALALGATTSLVGADEQRSPSSMLRKQPGNPSDRYIVVMRDGAAGRPGPFSRAAAVSQALARTHNVARVERVLSHAVNGFVARLPAAAAEALSRDPRVAYVEQDVKMTGGAVQFVAATNANWGLDRINQRQLPFDGQYRYDTDGAGVRAYIVDSGIRATHQDFGGRVVLGPDFVTNDPGNPNPGTSLDCYGHGTHVAGIVGGASYGVAKGVQLVSVRVLNCAGDGSSADLINAIDWVTYDHNSNFAPAVANLSVTTGSVPPSFTAIEDAVSASLDSGVTWVVVAGNNADAVANYSPGRLQGAVTVGASYTSGGSDMRATFSNIGPEVDLYAPGVGITSAYYTSDTAAAQGTGTSMAAPQVTGVIARFLQACWWAPPSHVINQVVLEHSTADVIADPGPGTPNRLLYSGFLDSAPSQQAGMRRPALHLYGVAAAGVPSFDFGPPSRRAWNSSNLR